MTVCDGADRVGAGPSFLFVEDRLIGAGRGSAWVLAVEVELLASHLEVELRLVGAGAEMVRSNNLLATLAFGVLVGERSLNKVVAGVAVSVAVALTRAFGPQSAHHLGNHTQFCGGANPRISP